MNPVSVSGYVFKAGVHIDNVYITLITAAELSGPPLHHRIRHFKLTFNGGLNLTREGDMVKASGVDSAMETIFREAGLRVCS